MAKLENTTLHAPKEVVGPERSPRAQRARLVGFFTFVALLAVAFIKPLISLMVYAGGTDLHSHILLVPLVSAYLLAIGWKTLPREYGSSFGWGLLAFAGGFAALAAGWRLRSGDHPLSQNDFFALMALAFVCLIAAGGFLFLGKRWMATASFPIAFLIFLAPLPDQAVDWLETASKYASADMAAIFFNLSGTPTLREGLVFQLPGIVIEVAQECSGIRSSWVLFITSLVASHMFLKSPWRRAVLVAFVIPLGLVRNGFRILVIGLLCVHIGPEMIHSIIHRRGGPVFFVLSLIPLFLLLWWLRRRDGRTGEEDGGPRWRRTGQVGAGKRAS